MGGERRLGCGCVRWVRGVTRAEEIREFVIFQLREEGKERLFEVGGVDARCIFEDVSRGLLLTRMSVWGDRKFQWEISISGDDASAAVWLREE